MLDWIGPLETEVVRDREACPPEDWPSNVPRELHYALDMILFTPVDINDVQLDVIDFGHGKPYNHDQSLKYNQKLIIDFEAHHQEEAKRSGAPMFWAAPEIVAGGNSTFKSDIWTLGCLVSLLPAHGPGL